MPASDGQHLRRHLLVELDVLLELRDDGAAQRLDSRRALRRLSATGLDLGGEVLAGDAARRCARAAPSTSTFTVPSGSFSSCRMIERERADAEEVLGRRLVDGGLSARPAGSGGRPSPHRAPGSTWAARRTAGSPCAGYTTTSRSGSSGRLRDRIGRAVTGCHRTWRDCTDRFRSERRDRGPESDSDEGCAEKARQAARFRRSQ